MSTPSIANPAPAAGVAASEFRREETHRVALWPDHRLLLDSQGLGWSEVYTSLATEQPWSRTLPALPHVALAYCVHRPASIHRRVAGEGAAVEAELRPRHFGMIPNDRDSNWRLRGSPDIQLVYLHRRLIDRVAIEAFGLDPMRLEIASGLGFSDPLLEQLAIALLDAARRTDGTTGELYVGGIAHLLALHVLRRHARRRSGANPLPAGERVEARRIRHVCDYIESMLAEHLSVARLAAEAGVSAHAFAPAFTRAMGVPPHSYVLRRRLERARQLLRDTDLPLALVAAQTGFASQSHMTTMFKRDTGLTPGAYRG